MSRSTGRRVAERPKRKGLTLPRVGADVVIGLVAVLVTGATFATVADPGEPRPDPARAPGASPLTEAVLTCPAGDTVSVAQLVEADGKGALTVAAGKGDPEPVDIAPGGSADIDVSKVAVLRATGALAPGLVAATRTDDTVSECAVPAGEWWFGAVGTGGLHASTIELTNPDGSPAIADLEVWGADGPVSSEAIRGIAVDGGRSVTRDLAELTPSGDDVSVRVVVRQGRLGVTMKDETVVGAEPVTTAHPATTGPSTRSVIPAVPDGEVTLVVTNPGDEVARAQVKVAGAESESVPLDLDAVPVPPGETVSMALDDNTRKLLSSGEAGLVVEGTGPLLTSATGLDDGKPVVMAAVDVAAVRSAVFLPALPDRTLVMTAAERATAVTVRFDHGKAWKGRLRPGVSTTVPLPDGATYARAETDDAHLGAVRARGPAVADWLPLQELREDRLVPVVRPDQLKTGR